MPGGAGWAAFDRSAKPTDPAARPKADFNIARRAIIRWSPLDLEIGILCVRQERKLIEQTRVGCDLDPFDVKVAKAARDGQEALARTLVSSWQSTEDGIDLLLARERYRRLHGLLSSGRMKVRVVPRDDQNVFVHGKAGVIEHADGRLYSFVGSVNDSASAFRHAYEILWGDDDAH